MWAKLDQFAALSDRALRRFARRSAYFETADGLIQLRPWVPTNRGLPAPEPARLAVVPPTGYPKRLAGPVPAWLRANPLRDVAELRAGVW